ncbi:hypothetical protein IVA79_26020 [Bradyrhizobium sp. 138]|uniref:hypothetical protein n=1 Tax=Bradyrhizobium sp. 138 TaxID=2782615 RepID=UPI001FFA806E|nr:hypothetical protein [Bradyrhizobium sp. 138]MCK1737344.1 hypothetical protein [Bradyrhizobium sp. 138]
MLHPYVVSPKGRPDKQKVENNPMHSSGIIGGAANPNNRLHIILERRCGGAVTPSHAISGWRA